eukprot:8152003-Alexandrium_andersonii.AAC.1
MFVLFCTRAGGVLGCGWEGGRSPRLRRSRTARGYPRNAAIGHRIDHSGKRDCARGRRHGPLLAMAYLHLGGLSAPGSGGDICP